MAGLISLRWHAGVLVANVLNVARSWGLPSLALVLGVVLAAAGFAQDEPVSGTFSLVAFVALAGWCSPLIFPRSIGAAQAQELSANDGRPIIYWRPGCQYCTRLRVRLGQDARRAYWVNIWSDPAGAAAVRAVTGGDETVPTLVAGAESFVNPDLRLVRERLRAG